MSDNMESQGDTDAAEVETSVTDSQETVETEEAGQETSPEVEAGEGDQNQESEEPALPESPSDYTFTEPDWYEGKVDMSTLESYQEFAHKRGMSQEEFQANVEFSLDRDKRIVEMYEAQQAEAREEVKKEMGDKLQANLDKARQVIRAAGQEAPEDDNTILDNPALFNFLLWADSKISEDNLGSATGHGASGDSGGDIADRLFGDMIPKKH